MSTSADAMRSGARDAQPVRSVLHMEMQAGERRLLTLFASSFLEWIKDESASSFARDVGTPLTISLDEGDSDAQTPTVHLTLTWPRSSAEASYAPDVPARRETPAASLFTYESQTPVFTEPPGVTMMMTAVLEQSRQHPRPSIGVRRVPDWIPEAVVAGAARGRQVLERWTDAAAESTADIIDRARPRGRQVGALWQSARLESLARAQSAAHLLRTRPSAVVRPMSWAAAGLFVASVIYVGWAFARPATRPVARGIVAAATPSPSQPATVMTLQTEKASAVLVADTRRTEAGLLPASSVPPAAPAIPAPSVNTGRATWSATRVTPAPQAQARSYVGSLVVTSEPEGADVSVDGVPQGRTPLTIKNLNIGSRILRLDLAGHQRWSWAVSVGANRRTPVAVRLYPATPASPPPAASSGGVSTTREKMF
jgi:hypothetical protein